MGFKDKLIKKQAKQYSSPAGGSQQNGEPKEYYPKSIGIYCVDNPKMERRLIRPHVIGLPPTHRTTNVEFKGNVFSATPVWYGKLFAEPIVVNMGYYPANALYTETETRIFPASQYSFDKKIPLINESGLDFPLVYDTLVPIESERKRIAEVLGKKISDKGRAYLEKELERLNTLPDDEKLRVRSEVKVIPKIFIPVLMVIVTEEEDEEGELIQKFEPKLAIFEETMGGKKAKSLVANKVIEDANDIAGMMDYLYDGTEGAVGQPIQLFRNPLAAEGKDTIAPVAVKLYEDKIPKALLPFFNIEFAPNIEEKDLLRIIVLEMIGLFAPKGDTDSIEGKLKEYFWAMVQKKEEN